MLKIIALCLVLSLVAGFVSKSLYMTNFTKFSSLCGFDEVWISCYIHKT